MKVSGKFTGVDNLFISLPLLPEYPPQVSGFDYSMGCPLTSGSAAMSCSSGAAFAGP